MRTDLRAVNKAMQIAVVILALLVFPFLCCSALMQGSPPGAERNVQEPRVSSNARVQREGGHTTPENRSSRLFYR